MGLRCCLRLSSLKLKDFSGDPHWWGEKLAIAKGVRKIPKNLSDGRVLADFWRRYSREDNRAMGTG